MKCNHWSSERAVTRTEVIVIIAVLSVLAVLLLPWLNRARQRAWRTCCNCNLKQVGLGCRQWAIDYTNSYPMGISTNGGGTMEYTTAREVFRHFQALSNEINTPKVLVCPTDVRKTARDFETMSNTNLSYFIGLDANEIYPAMFLAGDRNLTNGLVSPNGILNLTSNSVVGWTAEMHNGCGNVLLSDSSVQSYSDVRLREALNYPGAGTNRLALPVD